MGIVSTIFKKSNTIFYLTLEINFFNITNTLRNHIQTDNVDITLAQFDNFCTSIGPEME